MLHISSWCFTIELDTRHWSNLNLPSGGTGKAIQGTTIHNAHQNKVVETCKGRSKLSRGFWICQKKYFRLQNMKHVVAICSLMVQALFFDPGLSGSIHKPPCALIYDANRSIRPTSANKYEIWVMCNYPNGLSSCFGLKWQFWRNFRVFPMFNHFQTNLHQSQKSCNRANS